MYKNKLQESQSVIGQAINIIHGALLAKNEREAQHSRRVAQLCKEIAIAMQLPEAKVREMETIGLMHDIGKIAIRSKIIEKPGSLSKDEREDIKRHPEVGYRILSTSNDTADIALYVLTHHERYDGTGYPSGIKGEKIPLQARILAVADAYDAMTSARAYRGPLPRQVVLEELRNNAGTQFDPEIVKVFIEKVLGEEV